MTISTPKAIHTIRLTGAEIICLTRPVSGHGGFQALLKKLCDQLRGNSLQLSLKDCQRIRKYAQGKGGYQKRLDPIINELNKLEVF